ncbi:MAG: hypothetical protein ABJC61_14645 [Acidobacteriota bacterium]
MILSLLFLVVPALLAYVALDRAALLRSGLARGFAAWVFGVFSATTVVYGVATGLAPWTDGVLRKAALAVLVASAAGLFFARRAAARAARALFFYRLRPAVAGKVVFLTACGAFAFFFYRPHLSQNAEALSRSPVYWDLNVHAPIVQNFAFGDNFPAQNESFAGAPETYHFFFDLLTAVPVAFGVPLASAFLLVSAASLFAVLGLLAGFAEELAGGAGPGMLAALLACTSSSLRFWDALAPRGGRAVVGGVADLLTRRDHPYLASFVAGNPFAYNGTMYNLFYFLEERQLVFACAFLLSSVLLLSTRGRWSLPFCVAAGAAFGLFARWHLFVTISLGLALVWLLAAAPDRRKTAAIFIGMAVSGGAFLAWVAWVSRPEWFVPGGRPALRFNTAFSTMPGGPPFSFLHALGYWLYGWGLKAILGGAGLILAYRCRGRLFDALASILIPTFLLVNTVQVLPLSIYDNHKWLRPMSLFLDLAAGFFLVERIWFSRPHAAFRLAAVAAAMTLMTFSGVLELVPFWRSRPTVFYAPYPTGLTRLVRELTAPRDVFVSFEANALHMAGRKLFLGNDSDERGTASLVASAGFDVARRQRELLDLYGAATRRQFCDVARRNGIAWVEVERGRPAASGADGRSPGFEALSPNGRLLHFLDVEAFCGGAASTPPSRRRLPE